MSGLARWLQLDLPWSQTFLYRVYLLARYRSGVCPFDEADMNIVSNLISARLAFMEFSMSHMVMTWHRHIKSPNTFSFSFRARVDLILELGSFVGGFVQGLLPRLSRL